MNSLLNDLFTENDSMSINHNESVGTLIQKLEDSPVSTVVILKKETMKIFIDDKSFIKLLTKSDKKKKIKKFLKCDLCYNLEPIVLNKEEAIEQYETIIDSISKLYINEEYGQDPKMQIENIDYAPPVGGSGNNSYKGGLRSSTLLSNNLPTFKPYYIVSEFEEEVNFGTLFYVNVFLSRIAGKKSSIELWLQEKWKIDILVIPKSGFDLKNEFLQSITVMEENLNKPVQFILNPNSIGEGSFIITARYQGLELFQTEYKVKILPVGDAKINTSTTNQTILKGKPRNVPPDLLLLITQAFDNGKLTLKYFLHSPDNSLNLNYKNFQVEIHKQDLGSYFLDFFNGIDGLVQDTKEQRLDAIDKLKAKGATLYKDLFPEEFRRIFWNFHSKIKSIVIYSDEPWIPWEICFMYSEEEDITTGMFLCETFEISRWISGSHSPVAEINLESAAFVIPESNLVCPPEEKNQITSLFNTKNVHSTEVTASYNKVRESFLAGNYNVWHFSGHGTDSEGTNSDHYKILLNNGSSISPNDITGLKNIGKGKPIIFFNACQASRPGLGLTGLSGWPKQFIDNNVAAFIGAYWSVNDETAFKFAVKFYELLVSGETIAASLKKARLNIKDDGNPTWLAYTLYADPFAKITQS